MLQYNAVKVDVVKSKQKSMCLNPQMIICIEVITHSMLRWIHEENFVLLVCIWWTKNPRATLNNSKTSVYKLSRSSKVKLLGYLDYCCWDAIRVLINPGWVTWVRRSDVERPKAPYDPGNITDNTSQCILDMYLETVFVNRAWFWRGHG